MKAKWKIRHHIKPGDIEYLTYLHGILYAKEYDYDQTFEAYVADGLAEFVQSFSPDKDRIWLAETKVKLLVPSPLSDIQKQMLKFAGSSSIQTIEGLVLEKSS